MQDSNEFSLSFDNKNQELAYIQAELTIMMAKLEHYGIERSKILITCFANIAENAYSEKGEAGIRMLQLSLNKFLNASFVLEEPSLN